MNSINHLGLMLAAFLLPTSIVCAQSQYLYKFSFRGTSYQTDAAGNMTATPITEQTLLQDRAQAGGVDPSTLAIVYHVSGDPMGDTVEIVDAATGAFKAMEFGLFFGDDTTLGRTAVTNAVQTEIRRVDYIYTFDTATYLSPNTHSMGATFTTKRILTDSAGNVRTSAEGPIHWIVNPQNGNSTKVCTGTFTTAEPFLGAQLKLTKQSPSSPTSK